MTSFNTSRFIPGRRESVWAISQWGHESADEGDRPVGAILPAAVGDRRLRSAVAAAMSVGPDDPAAGRCLSPWHGRRKCGPPTRRGRSIDGRSTSSRTVPHPLWLSVPARSEREGFLASSRSSKKNFLPDDRPSTSSVIDEEKTTTTERNDLNRMKEKLENWIKL